MIFLSCQRCSNQFKTYPSSILKGAKWCSAMCKKLDRSENKVTGTRFYTIWQDIKRRCDNPKRENYKYYGGRGITYDPRWKHFENFAHDMKDGYKENMTIDRIDNDGNYCKKNCQWITMAEQNKKHRNIRILDFQGMKKTVTGWAEFLGVKSATLEHRLLRGWSIEKCLSTPIRKIQTRYNTL